MAQSVEMVWLFAAPTDKYRLRTEVIGKFRINELVADDQSLVRYIYMSEVSEHVRFGFAVLAVVAAYDKVDVFLEIRIGHDVPGTGPKMAGMISVRN